MYSREFSDKSERHSLPPHYGGTALHREKREEPARPPHTPPEECESHEPRKEDPCPKKEEPCHSKERSEGGFSLLRGLLRHGEDGGDLLLLLVAVLLLADGCEDDYLPFLLLLMLIVN